MKHLVEVAVVGRIESIDWQRTRSVRLSMEEDRLSSRSKGWVGRRGGEVVSPLMLSIA